MEGNAFADTTAPDPTPPRASANALEPTLLDRARQAGILPKWLDDYIPNMPYTREDLDRNFPVADPNASVLTNTGNFLTRIPWELPYAGADIVNAAERRLSEPVVSEDPAAVADYMMIGGAPPLGGVAAKAVSRAAVPDNAVVGRQGSGYTFRPTDAKMLDAGVARDLKRASVREGIANQSPREVFTALRNYKDDMRSAGDDIEGYSLYKDDADTGLGIFGMRDGDRFDVEWVGKRDGGRTGNATNRLGPRELRSAMRAFREQVPGVRVVEGVRSSGAGPGRTQRVRSKMFANSDDVTTGTVLDAVGRASNLPMDKASRLDRARKAGFDTENVYYHGTTSKFDEFGRIDGGNAQGAGYYFTQSPDVASNYAMGTNVNRITPDGDAGPSVIPTYLKNGRILDERKVLSAEELADVERALLSDPNLGRNWKPGELTSWFDRSYQPRGDNVLQAISYDPDDVNNILRAAGYVGRRSGDVVRGEAKSGADQVMIFNPRNIRSVNAAFDPAKKDSANLLAANPSTATIMDMIARAKDTLSEDDSAAYRRGELF
jgi:hypothetical protein